MRGRAEALPRHAIGVTAELLETGRDHTTIDDLAVEALRPTDGAL
jgi:hypothetical protein